MFMAQTLATNHNSYDNDNSGWNSAEWLSKVQPRYITSHFGDKSFQATDYQTTTK